MPTSMPAFLRVLLFVWAFVAVSTNLKVVLVPNIDWFLTALLVTYLISYCRPRITLPQLGLAAAILVAGVIGGDMVMGLVWAGKLLAIFLCTSCLATAPWPPTDAFRGLIASMFCNVLMVVLGMFGVPGMFQVVGAFGRSATLLNYPGSLWRAGAVCLFYFGYLFLAEPRNRVFSAVAVVGCSALVLIDGSRTGMIVLALLPLALAYVFFREEVAAIALVGTAAVMFLSTGLEKLTEADDSPLARMAFLWEGHCSAGDLLRKEAPDRYRMMERTLQLVWEHPLAGNGLRTAVVQADVDASDAGDDSPTQVVAHNGYLQMWAEAGLTGLVCFVLVVWAWLPLGNPIAAVLRNSDVRQCASLYNAMFLLVVFAFCLLFHPLSTEWSEWIAFSVPYATVAWATGPRAVALSPRTRHVCQPSAVA